jgi:protocatechuate 3,4-dioxygenase beta subunit
MIHHPGPASQVSRRQFARGVGAGIAALIASRYFEPGAFAEELERRAQTPPLTEGPFYPDRLPLDTDNDLLVIDDALTPAVGEVTQLGGRILDARGDPVKDALIEIWQVDAHGAYLHSGSANAGRRDANFQGYGRFVTGSGGQYRFRTIKPVAYPGRTPHIHVKVSVKGKEELTTQIHIKGEPRNARDGVLRGIRDPKLRELVMADFVPIKDSNVGELSASFDVVLGYTPKA